MIRSLLLFEVHYQLKQKAFPLFALGFLSFGLLAGNQGFAPANVNFNSPYQVNFHTALLSIGAVFAIMFFAVSGVLRDRAHGLEPMVYATALKKHHYFISRFLGVYIFSVFAIVPFLLGYGIAVSFGDLDPERVASFDLITYLQPLVYIILPNIFICCAILFAISMLTKHHVATYIGAVLIYGFYFICSIFLNSPMMAQSVPASPEAMALAAVFDPFGISAFFEQTQFWTAHQKNEQMLSFSGLYLLNRMTWIVLAIGILGITYRVFSFRSLKKQGKKKRQEEASIGAVTPYQPAEFQSGAHAQIQAFLSVFKLDLMGIIKSLPFMVVMLIWLAIVVANTYAHLYEGGAYGDSWIPFTNLLIAEVVDPLTIFGIILIVFYSGDVLWKERDRNFAGIIDATPTANWVFFLSKVLSLIALPMSLISSSIVIGITFQLSTGYFDIALDQYLSMYYINGMQLYFFCILAVFIQTLSRNKFLGMGLTVLCLVLTILPQSMLEHVLIKLAYLPRLSFSNMTGYSTEFSLFNDLTAYWFGLIGMLGLLSFKLWQRGKSSLKNQIVKLRHHWKKWEKTATVGFLGLFVLAGVKIYYHTNVTTEYFNASDVLDYREKYERKYKALDSIPRMYQTAIKTEVNLFPKEGKYTIKATNQLINRADKPMHHVFITERETMDSVSVENAQLVFHDKEFGAYLFEFNAPLRRGEEVKFGYQINYQDSGYQVSDVIADNGTYLTHRHFEPILKYREGLEIADSFEREKRGLPPKKEENSSDAHLSLEDIKMGRVDFETVVSTDGDETAISSGKLMREWKAQGRNFYHYKSAIKVIPTMAYFSAPYDVKIDTHDEVAITQYYHPDHAFNVDSIAHSAKAALAYCAENFGSYPFDHLRIAEVPSHWPFGGFAHPGMISMVEDRLYLSDISNADGFNLVAKRTIHEVAHQWWGHKLIAKIAPGGSVFVEAFAKYTEGVVMDQMYDKHAIIQLSKTARNRYFKGRAFASEAEPPLYLVEGQGYLSYGKGFTVMMGLRELIGESVLNSIIRNMIEEHADHKIFELTTEMFLEKLYAVVTDDEQILIDDWFKRVVTYDLSVAGATTKILANGQYEVTLQVEANRWQTNEEGEEIAIGINEAIQIGFFKESLSISSASNNVISIAPIHFNESESEVKIILYELPKYITIDPYGTRSEEGIIDNTFAL